MTRLLIVGLIFLLSQAEAAQTCNDFMPASTPDSRFIVNGGEVTDLATGLIWQRCSLGQTGSDCSGGGATGYSWTLALQAADDEKQLTGKPWRLPNVKELRSIVEEKCHDPAINLVVFPGTPASNFYRTASPSTSAFNSNRSWWVHFGKGNSFHDGTRTSSYSVRLVRDGI